MTTIQWIMHYRMIVKHKSEESRAISELIKSVAEPTFEIFGDMFTQNAEFISFFSNPRKFADYLIEKKKKAGPGESSVKTEDELLDEAFDLFMNSDDIFPEDLTVDLPGNQMQSTGVKRIDRRMVGIQKK